MITDLSPILPDGQLPTQHSPSGPQPIPVQTKVNLVASSLPLTKMEHGTGESSPSQDQDESDELVLVRMADVESKPIEWLWPNHIPLGKITIFAGDPGLGKSFVTTDIAARVSRGSVWPGDDAGRDEPGSVLLLSAEDDPADTIRPRLDSAGANPDLIYTVPGKRLPDKSLDPFNLTSDLTRLERKIRQLGNVRLIIIDPVTAYLGDTDDHKNGAIRALMLPLSELAARNRLAVVLVTHCNKNGGGKAVYRAMGSLAFVATARTAWQFSKDPEDSTRRLILPIKNNIGSDLHGLAYRIVEGIVQWEPEPVQMTADDLLSAESNNEGRKKKRDEAADFLREILADGPLPADGVL